MIHRGMYPILVIQILSADVRVGGSSEVVQEVLADLEKESGTFAQAMKRVS